MNKENKGIDTESKHKPNPEQAQGIPITLRGSGFGYDEDKEHTDKADLINGDKADQAVKLPNLGKKNLP